MVRNRRFQFSFEATLLGVLVAALCYAMGYWQLNRYHDKRAYFEQVADMDRLGLLQLDDVDDWQQFHHASVRMKGFFDHKHNMMIINRSLDDRPGVKLVTPLKLEDGRHILVDRGFIPYAAMQDNDLDAYLTDGETTVTGRIRPSQEAQFFIKLPEPPAKKDGFRRQWHRLDIDEMAAQLPYPVIDVYIENTQNTENTLGEAEFPAPLTQTVIPASRHMNYTIQWTSFGTFALLIAFMVQFKRPVTARRDQVTEHVGADV